MILGTILVHGILEVIYEMDFRRFFRGKVQLMIFGGVVAICALTMKMDLLGYDSYFPAYDNLQGVVINVSNQMCIRDSLNGPKVTKSQVIEEALERMSLSDHRDQVIMVGDREHDILGARRCGIQCVAVSYGYGSREELEKAQPLQIVASADELLNFFV